MSDDIARLGLQVNSDGVAKAHQRLRDFQNSARGAGGAARDLGSSTADLNSKLNDLIKAQSQTNELLKAHASALRDATVNTESYTDRLAKLATAGAAIYVAYQGMAGAIRMSTDAMRDQVSIMDRLAEGAK